MDRFIYFLSLILLSSPSSSLPLLPTPSHPLFLGLPPDLLLHILRPHSIPLPYFFPSLSNLFFLFFFHVTDTCLTRWWSWLVRYTFDSTIGWRNSSKSSWLSPPDGSWSPKSLSNRVRGLFYLAPFSFPPFCIGQRCHLQYFYINA